MKQVAIFASTRWELNVVSQVFGARGGGAVTRICSVFGVPEVCLVWFFQTGIGPENARRVLEQVLLHHTFDLVISTGFACALSGSKVGDILIGSEVFSYPHRPDAPEKHVIKVPEHFVEYSQRTGKRAGISCSQGTFVSTPFAVCHAHDKSRIRTETGAIGLDMESAALAQTAHDRHVDFLIVRGVSDLVDEDLPVDFNLFFQKGRHWLRVGLASIFRPSCWVGLNRLRKQSMLAAHHMTAFFQMFFQDVNSGEPESLVYSGMRQSQ